MAIANIGWFQSLMFDTLKKKTWPWKKNRKPFKFFIPESQMALKIIHLLWPCCAANDNLLSHLKQIDTKIGM